MTIKHHADDATLMSYSAGTLGEALSAVVAGHIAVCPSCRSELAQMDELGGLMLSALPNAAMLTLPPRPATLENASAKPAGGPARGQEAKPAAGAKTLPLPLSRLTGCDLNAIAWKRLSLGVWHHRLPLSAGAKGDLRLIKIAPGQVMPEHGHSSTELTLVLDGSYTDQVGRFAKGDLADLDEEIEHQPIADETTGCICLIASEEKARFKSLLARIVQPFTGL
ncbi:MAG: ChrR family anti-sigma-E factor [Hyphomicrobiaceae bacterium]